MSQSSQTVHYRACNSCEVICGVEIAVEDGKIVSIRGDEEGPFSRGHICPKARALQDVHRDPDRLKHPMRRARGDDWERVSWGAALDEASERLSAVPHAWTGRGRRVRRQPCGSRLSGAGE